MIALIFFNVFGSVFLLTWFLIVVAIPFFVNKYNQLQESRLNRFTERMEESYIFVEKKKVLFITLAPVVFAVAGFLLIRNPVGLALGLILGFASPNLFVHIAKLQRIKKFRSQIVDSLMILSSSLKAGLSFIQAIEILCEEMPAPISQEFNLVLKENKWGMSLEDSLRKLRERVVLEEVNLLVSSILIAREAGGELTKVIERLVETIRNNLKLKEKIATLTLQGRLQGIIMVILPIAFTYFIYRQNPNHFDIMLETQVGRMLIIVAIVAQLLGMYLIKKISTAINI